MADRYLYLPSYGFCLFLAFIIFKIKKINVPKNYSKALVITVFQYNASKFNPPVDNPIYKDFIEDLKIAKACGVKQFQMNIKITDEYAELISIIENEII